MNCLPLGMETLPVDVCLKIFCFLDYQHLVLAQQAYYPICFPRLLPRPLVRTDSNPHTVIKYLDANKPFIRCWQHDPEVCRKWKFLASDNSLWSNLFKERWGEDRADFYAPNGSKSWKDVFEVQDRCDRVGVGLKIIREGCYYYLVHQGEIQRCLGSRRDREEARSLISHSNDLEREFTGETGSCLGILDKILFFIGDLEVASADAKRSRVI